MKIGTAVVCINPEVPTELSGYGYYLDREATGIWKDIYTRAVYLQEGDNRFLLICSDLLAYGAYVVDQVKAGISDNIGIPAEHILLLCTHTHTAPSAVKTIGCGKVNWKYIEMLIQRMIQCGCNAAADTVSVLSAYYLEDQIQPVGYNRADPDGPVDSHVYGVRFQLENGSSFYLANYGCHPVTVGRDSRVFPDYPYEVIHTLEQHGCHGIFLNGCCGDIDPVSNQKDWGSGTEETVAEYGNRIAMALLNQQGVEIPLDSFAVGQFPVSIPLRKYDWDSLHEVICSQFSKDTIAGADKAVCEWEEVLQRKILNDPNPFVENNIVQYAKIGPLILLGLQGELYTQIGLDIRAGLQDNFLLIGTNANSATRYIATREDIRQNSYGSLFSNIVYAAVPVTEDAADILSQSIVKMFRNANS